MTALSVVALIVVFVAADWMVLRLRRREEVDEAPTASIRMPRPPADRFVDQGHSWARLTARGLQIGIDDLLAAALGQVDRVQVPGPGKQVARGEPLVRLRSGGRWIEVAAPVSGEVLWHNKPTVATPSAVTEDPYGVGWVVALEVQDQQAAIEPLHLGDRAVTLLRQEHARLGAFLDEAGQAPVEGALQRLDASAWEQFQAQFLDRPKASR